ARLTPTGRLKPAPTYGESGVTRGKAQRTRTVKAESRSPSPDPRSPVAPVALALALSGFAGLVMEILWFRHFSIMLGAFRAVFALLLTVILVGIGAGALLAAPLQRRSRHAGTALLAVQSLFIVATLAGMWMADSSAIDVTVS